MPSLYALIWWWQSTVGLCDDIIQRNKLGAVVVGQSSAHVNQDVAEAFAAPRSCQDSWLQLVLKCTRV